MPGSGAPLTPCAARHARPRAAGRLHKKAAWQRAHPGAQRASAAVRRRSRKASSGLSCDSRPSTAHASTKGSHSERELAMRMQRAEGPAAPRAGMRAPSAATVGLLYLRQTGREGVG